MEKKQKRRKEKGITLVALVVTIIVLIILAGVTLNIVLDQDGIISKAQQAAEDYERAQREEQEMLNQVEDYMNNLGGGSSEETYPKAPIPDGYVASQVPGEDTEKDGLVIYEGNDPVTEENHEDAMKNRNQYVWIPVTDINSMVMCSSNTGDSVCDLVYNKETKTLACTNPDHTATATELAGRTYLANPDYKGDGIYYTQIDFNRRDQTYQRDGYGSGEPAVVASKDGNSDNLELAGMPAGSTAVDFLQQLKQDFIDMATSVAKNGGFYVSRYEIGANGEAKKGQKVLTAYNYNTTTYLGANGWHGLYGTIRDINNNKQMIWGCQYDQIIKFIGDEAEIGHVDRELSTSKALSGENGLDKMKNIYDLEGNFRVYTLEVSNDRILCGGGAIYVSKYAYPASFKGVHNMPGIGGEDYSSLSTLYL